MEAAPSSERLWMLQTELSQRQGEQHVYSLLVYSPKETFGQKYTFFSNIEEISHKPAK